MTTDGDDVDALIVSRACIPLLFIIILCNVEYTMESLRDGCDAAKGIVVGCENQLLNFEGLERDERVVMMRQVDRKKSIRRHQTIA